MDILHLLLWIHLNKICLKIIVIGAQEQSSHFTNNESAALKFW